MQATSDEKNHRKVWEKIYGDPEEAMWRSVQVDMTGGNTTIWSMVGSPLEAVLTRGSVRHTKTEIREATRGWH